MKATKQAKAGEQLCCHPILLSEPPLELEASQIQMTAVPHISGGPGI